MAQWKPETRQERSQRLLEERPKAWADYENHRTEVEERTARLKALRLAKEAREAVEIPAPKIVPPKPSARKARRPFVQGSG